MIRILAMISGLLGGLALSQFPEFSQQYLQRLSGAVNELKVIVDGFDEVANDVGQSREEALDSMPDSGVGAQVKQGLARAISRYERLDADLQSLRAAGPVQRLAQPWNIDDRQLVRDTLEDYKPAVPATIDGAITAGIGYLLGWGMVFLSLRWVASLFHRPRKRARG